MKHFWAVGQIDNKAITKNTAEILGCLNNLSSEQLAEVAMVLVGSNLRIQAPVFGRMGQPLTILIESDDLKMREPTLVGREIADLAYKRRPELVVCPHNAWGAEVAAKIAARNGMALVTDVHHIEGAEDGLIVERYSFGGQSKSRIFISYGTVLTLHPGAFSPPKPADITTTVEMLEPATGIAEIIKILDHIEPGDSEGPSLTDSKIIVSCGRGMGCKENLIYGRKLAQKLGAAFGASRAVVDAGWVAPSHQVGLTGKVVSPRLYIACGISGADQHLAGMRQSDIVVAINRDPDAPIFKVATVGIVGDCMEVLPALIEYL
ncbi:MAG TPA: electron transfer flavoprotein subunit alpha/FixB family protein [Caldisericia bacterium]|nr:electron transfer flavoprotein subunit alpha/FixB family protein [Caldisericia bacterium]HPF49189.1 electron transfer flavoprotein subunit alpha/FixB family protein [Caldisericia bacterium]HPI84132.1 electron transfer flavoprotein subunit alpha/FixB family protein [Caldisericia bacterium]HPQ93389.1 electron transfer flavoprotein subunit alpha/FixB family protein [Caldisericia bacterium]HRV75229.1 electron transfer flavoprotein subunit alpha/FixB family protein [Caldisericia bacterium]